MKNATYRPDLDLCNSFLEFYRCIQVSVYIRLKIVAIKFEHIFHGIIFLGIIYFDVGHKNPKIILNNNCYLIYRKLPDKTMWSCTQYHKKDRCKAKVMTYGRQATIIGDHNHAPTCVNKYIKNMHSQTVTIKKASGEENFVR